MEDIIMGLKDKFINFIAPIDDEDGNEEYIEEAKAPVYTPAPAPKPTSGYENPRAKIRPVSTDTKMVLFEPRSFEEAEEIAIHLKNRKAAVVNLHRLPRDYAQRTIDFLNGVVFALDGVIQKIGHNVILCTPKSIGVEGGISLTDDE